MDFCVSFGSGLLADFSFTDPAGWWAIGQVVLGLGFVIFVHELGHFLVAKACGVKCEKFYVGFDMFDIKVGDRVLIPRALLKAQWGETEYGIGVVPLGGYVKMLGQDDNPANMQEEHQRSIKSEDGAESENVDSDEPELSGELDRTELDPRSYQAKSVWQRMAIISAGVIMNLFFAVIFATIAFRTGVSYTPVKIGNVMPGSPAFEQNLTGAEVVALDGVDMQGRYFRFEDLMEKAILSNGEPFQMSLDRDGPDKDGPLEEILITASETVSPGSGVSLLGGSAAQTLKLTDAPLEGHAAARASVPMEKLDVVLKADGVELESGNDLIRHLVSHADLPVTLNVQRKSDKEGEEPRVFDTTLPPNRMMDTGLVLKLGKIVSVQVDSPAVGRFEVGDRLLEINGQPVGDPFALWHKLVLLAREDKAARVKIAREGEGTPRELEVEIAPRLPRLASHISSTDFLGFDSLGISVELTREVEAVEPGSPAAAAGFQPGDVIQGLQFKLDDERLQESKYERLQDYLDFEHKNLKKRTYIANALLQPMQDLRTPVPMEFRVRRGEQTRTLTLTPVESETKFYQLRGLPLGPTKRIYVSYDLWESFQLGIQQTREDMMKVVKFLGKLIKGDIAVTNLGGPGTIATVATLEASEGTSRLLLFLTLLSANLAIVNFLPIPVLDGGHMVFLTYEAIFRRPVNLRMQEYLTYAGLLFILMLMVFVIGLDITRFAGFF